MRFFDFFAHRLKKILTYIFFFAKIIIEVKIMNNKIYCSTGTIVGRVNNFNYKLFTENHKSIAADGFELMMVKAYYDILPELCREIERVSAAIRVVHAEKDIGGLLPESDGEIIKKAFADFETNCRVAEHLGAKKMVFHLWSAPHSDRYFEKNLSYLLLKLIY